MVLGILNIAPGLKERDVFYWQSLEILNVFSTLFWNKFSEKHKPFTEK